MASSEARTGAESPEDALDMSAEQLDELSWDFPKMDDILSYLPMSFNDRVVQLVNVAAGEAVREYRANQICGELRWKPHKVAYQYAVSIGKEQEVFARVRVLAYAMKKTDLFPIYTFLFEFMNSNGDVEKAFNKAIACISVRAWSLESLQGE